MENGDSLSSVVTADISYVILIIDNNNNNSTGGLFALCVCKFNSIVKKFTIALLPCIACVFSLTYRHTGDKLSLLIFMAAGADGSSQRI